MAPTQERKHEANRLRQEGCYAAALSIYRDLWEETHDQYFAAGVLHCLRKERLFDQAIPLADDLFAQRPELAWCRVEITWTYIQGMIYKDDNDKAIDKTLDVAERVLELNSGETARNVVVLRVLKLANSSKRWNIINEWALRIDPASLSSDPRVVDGSGRTGWSDQALWYNYRIKGLIYGGDSNDTSQARELADMALKLFPKEQRFFARLKARAEMQMGNLSESEDIYRSLCSNNPEWWMLWEYSIAVRDQGRDDDALQLMYRATQACKSLKLMVKLLRDIGLLCLKMGRPEEAIDHLVLCRFVREEQGWSLPTALDTDISTANEIAGSASEPSSLKETLRLCRRHWDNAFASPRSDRDSHQSNRNTRFRLLGRVKLGPGERTFCFIDVKGGPSIYCRKSDLPPGTENGDDVVFDAQPSYDRKKDQESWEACNVRQMVVGRVR